MGFRHHQVYGSINSLDELASIAFCAISYVRSGLLLVSITGVRALGPFTDPAKLKDTSVTTHARFTFFLCMDVALSAGLLAGGADGIHSVVNSITSFFNATAAKSSG